MASNPTPEFRAEAVRVALTSGLPRKPLHILGSADSRSNGTRTVILGRADKIRVGF